MIGRNHPVLRRFRALRRDRRGLAREGLVIAEGIHLVLEAIGTGTPLEVVLASPSLERVAGGGPLLAALHEAGIEPVVASDETVAAVQDARGAQPVVALVRLPERQAGEVIPGRAGTPLVVVAHGVQDPGNLGAVLRAADAAGATGLVATGPSADLRHPRTVRATMGSVFRLPWVQLAESEALGVLHQSRIPLRAADPRRGPSYDRVDWRGPVALVVGGEGAGLVEPWLRETDEFVRIPMHAGVESLSVPASASVLLFEAARQRRASGLGGRAADDA